MGNENRFVTKKYKDGWIVWDNDLWKRCTNTKKYPTKEKADNRTVCRNKVWEDRRKQLS